MRGKQEAHKSLSSLKLICIILLVGRACSISANERPLFKYLSPVNGSFIEPSVHGYIPTDDRGNDLFYWYFPSRGSSSADPLIVWFTGGPGCSSSLAMLTELGPFKIASNGQQVRNEFSWNTRANLLFIDNPIGTGFSHANDDDMARTEADVATAISKFFSIWIDLEPFQTLARRPIFITGESYAGHYVPFIANALFQMKDPRIIIKGAAVGNGMINSAVQFESYIDYSVMNQDKVFMTTDMLNQMRPKMKLCQAMMKLSPKPITDRTFPYCWKMVKSMVTNPTTGQKNFNWYDINKQCIGPLCYDFTAEMNFMNSPKTLRDLNSDQKWATCNGVVESTISRLDWISDCSPQVTQLLEAGVNFLAFYGDLDWICNWVGGNVWSDSVSWSGQAAYKNAAFQPYLGGIGQIRSFKNFQFVRFFNAGHMVPMDQAEKSLTMITDFITQSLKQPNIAKETK